jgi:DnaJ-class molecular chaperone
MMIMIEGMKNTRLFLFLIACVVGLQLLSTSGSDTARNVVALALVVCLGCWWFRLLRRKEPEEIELRRNAESAYIILGVDPEASGEEIRRAYRVLAQQHHPDHFPDAEKLAAANSLARVHRAYQIVGNADARFDYDMYVKSCCEGFPRLDEAYAYIQERREMLGDMLEEAEQTASQIDPEVVHEVTCDEGPLAQSRVQASEPVCGTRNDGIDLVEPSQARLQWTSSGECVACGEPFQIAAGRTGPFHCQRCGEELPSVPLR